MSSSTSLRTVFTSIDFDQVKAAVPWTWPSGGWRNSTEEKGGFGLLQLKKLISQGRPDLIELAVSAAIRIVEFTTI
jgi:hypothetical protein